MTKEKEEEDMLMASTDLTDSQSWMKPTNSSGWRFVNKECKESYQEKTCQQKYNNITTT